MKRSTIVFIVVIAVIVVLGGLLYASRKPAVAPASPSPSAASKSPSTAAAASASPAASAQAESGAVVLTFTGAGFSPSNVTVMSGHQLTVKNASNNPLQFDSDPHPVHTDDTDLNFGPISPGAGNTMTLTKKGTFGVHNHLNPSQKATVTIQ